jgi:hypothetical protein
MGPLVPLRVEQQEKLDSKHHASLTMRRKVTPLIDMASRALRKEIVVRLKDGAR